LKTTGIDFRPFEVELKLCAQTWMQSQVFARENPHHIALFSAHGNRSFLQLHENANRLANVVLAHGLVAGDAVAMMCRNRAEFVEILLGCMRIGVRLTPISTQLTEPEVAYIVGNCEAKLFFIDAAFVATAPNTTLVDFARINPYHPNTDGALPTTILTGSKLPVTIVIDAATNAACHSIRNSPCDYATALGHAASEAPIAPTIGSLMLYTSGTTGQPKGVFRNISEAIAPQYAGSFADYQTATDVSLCCGPAYHSAPLLFDVRWALASGVPLVMLAKWDTLEVLNLIERHGVTHTHMVATMFQRLLGIDAALREAKNLTSLRLLVHGAAPCPVETKRAMIAWLGPVLIEYYGATEGGNGINISSQEWLQKPGSVGRIDPSLGHEILDENMQAVAEGVIGRIYFKAPIEGRFAYFGDAEKTAAAYAGDRFTLGDMGYMDADRYLFLTGRVAECIISGGVNIYPQEIDNVLLRHPDVRDVCTVGVPDAEWGEQVASVVVLVDPLQANTETAAALMRFAANSLASYKRPRRIVFQTELPRSATGKLLRQQVRQTFWVDKTSAI
jgi:long-chain acyl-CoA synthetase